MEKAIESPESPLRQFRKGLGLNLKQFANALGVSDGHLSEVETGVADVSEKLEGSLLALADRLGIVVTEQRRFFREKNIELKARLRLQYERRR